ncbi:outer membrane protein assembly factor BamB family protein [Catellatospora citrea]|uniref:Pyrrolo-quinoline quinone repeat domain-containing protein n=1 Tax=Catellatospora citrea TaxID=53366 RepID=A0A8J3NZM3_9ACTN|nr:PQQ-binding-like beta-propeller repeat protein [Catellatospora citrea]RKE10114.1 putative pyrroloquinoline-quinone binding quinoprotein [Catellatospora citrea]GIF97976.1 hypothetical protein Cci01nite_30700 [Catellatospora citrea]
MTTTGAGRHGPAVIDLGAGWREPDQHLDEPRQWRTRSLALVLAVALTAALGGAAVNRPGLTEFARVTLDTDVHDGRYSIVGDVVLVPDRGNLSAYELRDGSRRWRVPAPGLVSQPFVTATAEAGVAVLEQAETGTGVLTRVVDLADGATLWRSSAVVVPVDDVAVEYPVMPDPAEIAAGAPLPPADLRVFDLRSGQVRWRLRGDVATVDLAARTGWAISATGAVTAYDLRDGQARSTGTLRLPEGRVYAASAADGVLALGIAQGDSLFEEHFETATFEAIDQSSPLWARTDCGPSWCALAAQPGGEEADPVVVDRADGQVRYRLPANSHGTPSAAGLLVFTSDLDQPLRSGLAVLQDPVTGRVLRDLAGWTRPDLQPYPPIFLTREVGPAGAGRLQIARLTPDGLRLLTELPFRVRGCAFAEHALVCVHDGNQLTFWRLRG